ncbi:VOC family protein [Pseudorhodoplanes sp.]|uniref:VOC family protein n=1 Tax=Pseudorhodoplanes sp. TaxID=1934341 RepID=UPI00391B629C
MIKVSSIGCATFETPDIERLLDYYVHVLGLSVMDRNAREAVLSASAGTPAVVLRSGSVARCAELALEAAPECDLGDARKLLEAMGVKAAVETDTALAPVRVVMQAPDDIQVSLVARRVPAQTQHSSAGINPKKLGHMAFNVHDVQNAAKFFTDCLGFRVSDWMGDFFVFLRCGPDHHTVNLLHGKKNKMHHIAFEAHDWCHIKDACDFLGKQKIPLIWGPGRHGIGHNLFIYHHTPDGQIMELYAELDQMTDEASGAFDPRPWHEDNPQRPKVWQPGPQTSNIWGIPTPQLFRD